MDALQGRGEDVQVQCTSRADNAGAVKVQQLMLQLEHSIFALAVPGEDPSTRLLSDIFLAGTTVISSCSEC